MQMISVAIDTSPALLRDSVFFKSLDASASDDIHIPAAYYNAGEVIDSLQALGEVFATLRFWGANSAPASILQFCLDNATALDAEISGLATEYQIDLPYLKILCRLDIGSEEWALEAYHASAAHSLLPWLKVLQARGYKWDETVLDCAAFHGHLACVQYLTTRGLHSFTACTAAAKGGHLDCLTVLHKKTMSGMA